MKSGQECEDKYEKVVGWPFEECCEEVSKYDIISKVWKSVVVPTIMYGMDVVT